MIDNYCSYAVVIVNFRTDGNPQLITKTASQLGLYHPKGYQIEDVFHPGKSDIFNLKQTVSATIPPNGAVFWRFRIIGAHVPQSSENPPKESEIFSNFCKDKEDRIINLPDRMPYSVDLIGIIYLAVVLVMLFIMVKSRVGVFPREAIA